MIPILERVANEPPPSGHRISVARLDATTSLELTELWETAGRVARGLRGLGVSRGDRVGVMAANSLEWVLLDLAAVRLGAVVAGLEPGKFALDASLRSRYDLAAVFTDQPCDLPGYHAMSQVSELAAGNADGPPLEKVRWGPRDPVAVKFTSGSTGTPKSLTATVCSVDCSLRGVQELFSHGPGDNLFVFLPLSLLQQRYWVYSALAFGHDITISTYEAAFVTMGRVEPTVVMGVPAFFEAAQRHIERQAASRSARSASAESARALFGSKIRYLWTGSAPAALAMLEFFTTCGLPIYEGYGMNETCIVTKNAPGAARPGSVGKALPGRRVVIGDDGVVSVHSDCPVASRYEHAPARESERIFVADGVVRTGDLGYLDDDGFLFLTGRADDVIVLDNGRKVVVRPIEEFVRTSPSVAECVLFCPTDSRIVAVVSPADPSPDLDAIYRQIALSNAAFGHDEQIKKVVVAREPFTIANDLLTSQHKPRRRQILTTYQSEIADIRKLTDMREGTHVH